VMAKWAVQCKAISSLDVLFCIRVLELCGFNYGNRAWNRERWLETLSRMVDSSNLPPKIIKRKIEKLESRGLVGFSMGPAGWGLKEKGMAELEKNGVYRWHSLTSMPTPLC
jgi:hypothetical protein